MTEEEIKMQLEVKNKEIYLNKLNLDLNNNVDSLVLTIDNLLNKLINETINHILSIAESFREKDVIEKDVKDYFNLFCNELMNCLDIKKKEIEKLIKNNNINYKEFFDKENDKLNNKLYNYYTNNIKELSDKIQSYYDDSFCKQRINNYLTNTLRDNLLDKFNETIKSRDIILINTFKETYLKYLELNKNTIG